MKKIRRRRIEQTRRKILRSWQLYLFLVPALVYFIVFHYVPMFGVQIAFKDYRARAGIWGSKWVGLKHFQAFVTSFQFTHLVLNTVWGRRRDNMWVISVLVWSLLTTLYLGMLEKNMWILFFLGIPAQIVTILAFHIKLPTWKRTKKK